MKAARMTIQSTYSKYFFILLLLKTDFLRFLIRFLSLPDVGEMEYCSVLCLGVLSIMPEQKIYFIDSTYDFTNLKSFLANRALSPKASSILNNWLYFATRSERESEPVLICPVLSATARSAMVLSSVSPER
jgi:hypothetical protein